MNMLSSFKRLTKHSAVYGVGHIIARLVNFLLLPLYTNRLSAKEFGAAGVLYAFLAVMTIIYTIGIDAAFLRYFILSDDAGKRRQVFSTAFWCVLLTATTFTSLIYAYANGISGLLISEGNHAHLLRLSALILFFDALAFLPFLFLRAEEKSVFYTSLKFVNVVINVALNIYFIVYLKQGVQGMFLANVWSSGCTFGLLSLILVRHISFRFSIVDLRALLRFGLPFLPSTLSVVILDLIDRPLLERLAGLEATGIYNAGAKLGMFMALMVTAFRFAWHPFFLSTSKQENAKEIFAKVLTYFTTINAAVFLTLVFFLDQIVRFKFFGMPLIGADFLDGLRVVPLILLSYVFYGMYVNFIVGIYLEEKTHYLPLITFAGAAVNIATNIILIPRIGMMGAGWARLSGHLVMCVMLYLFAQRFYTIRYEFDRLLKLAVVVGVAFYVGTTFQGAWQGLVKLSLLALLPVVLYLSGFFDRRELNALKSLLNLKSS
ncbi:MAG: oligosaccharide flippase family protein [bacterium]